MIRRFGPRSRKAAPLAVALVFLLLAGGVVFHGVLLSAWSREERSADFLATHVAQMRDELVRIHRGKVDDRALEQILNAQATASEEASGQARETGDLQSGIREYLAGGVASNYAKVTKIAFLTGDDADSSTVAPSESAAPIVDDRTYVGQKTCETCHQNEAANWAHTIHAAVFTLNPRNATEAQGCEACHGPGSAHVKNPSDLTTIISFSHKSQTPIAQQNAQCLTCHQGGQRIFWHGSTHETNNLACSDCHNPMTNFSAHGLTARESVNQTCFQCHKVQRAEFNKRSHMPLLEGKLSCVDCHNPHGSTTAPLLKADSVNEVCYGCHAEKRGPFLFEHAPVRESCLNCHNPHGSNFEALLVAPRPLLCQQCHAEDGHPAQLLAQGNRAGQSMPDPRLISTSCQTCHVNIHGSNSPSGPEFER
jgi:DmsE family decaheme c-type cytochrome